MRMFKSNKIFFAVLLAFVISFLLPFKGWGQAKTITIQVFRVDDLNNLKNATVWPGVKVFGFNNKKRLDNFKKFRSRKEPIDVSEYDEISETDAEGFCELKLSPVNGYFIVYPQEEEEQTEYKDFNVGNRFEHTIYMKVGRSLGGVTKTAVVKDTTVIVPPTMCGKTIPISIAYLLYSDEVDVKDRILVDPIVTIIETGDTLGRLSPFIMNGEEFLKASHRRLGFDYRNDPFYDCYKGDKEGSLNEKMVMRKSHQKDYMYMDFALTPIDRGLHYMVQANRYWIRNYNEPYKQDLICLHDGPVVEPMRFLDYNVIEEPLQRGRNGIYYRKKRTENLQNREKLFLNFLQGEAILDPNDSTNFKQLSKMTETMSIYDTDNSGILRLDIHGCASPEGNYELNSRLSKDRAHFLKNKLRSERALYNAYAADSVFVTSEVATWKDVGKYLFEDSFKIESQMVLNIVERTNNMRQQEQLIRGLSCWPLIESKILPRLRYVDVQYNCFANRAKSREEIWEQYQTDPNYRSGKKVQFPYEFYELFDLIKNQEDKEHIAQVAYERVKEHQRPYPWALAACELARCKLLRGNIDKDLVNMLRPYINKGVKNIYNWRETDDYINDPAIVTTYINILCKDGDFAEAYTIADRCLPYVSKYDTLRTFLKCLNCQWDDPGVRDTVMNSSYWNKAVILAASEIETDWRGALDMLCNENEIDQANPRTLYMKAQLLFKLFGKFVYNTNGYSDDNFKEDESRMLGGIDSYSLNVDEPFKDIGIPLVQCCLIDSNYLDVFRWDGVFSTLGVKIKVDYRQAFFAYWKKVKSGELPMPKLPEPTAQNKKQAVETEKDVMDSLLGIDE